MKNLRTHGNPPFNIAVLHGGPGAPGQMAPVARELSSKRGLLEPLQTATFLAGLILEMRAVLEKNGDIPLTLIGSSWGVMLGFIFSAYQPKYVKKLILVGSGVYDRKFADKIQEVRLNRLDLNERGEAQLLKEALSRPDIKDKNRLFGQTGRIAYKGRCL